MTTLITPFSLFLLLLLPVPGTHSPGAHNSPDATPLPDGASPTSLQIPQEPSVDTAAFLAAFEPLRILTLEENESFRGSASSRRREPSRTWWGMYR